MSSSSTPSESQEPVSVLDAGTTEMLMNELSVSFGTQMGPQLVSI